MDTLSLPTLVLVGERFTAFAEAEGVQTVNRFIASVRAGQHDATEGLVIRAGQGIDGTDLSTVRTALTVRGLLDRFRLPSESNTVSPTVVHKHREANVLLADLRQAAENRYAARLRLADDNELIVDHLTGTHIQGMVLIEAARQLMLAVTEEFVLPTMPEREWVYVMSTLDTRFERCVFPVGVDLELTFTPVPGRGAGRPSFDATVTISQAGAVAAVCRSEYRLFDRRALDRCERQQAAAAIAAEAPRAVEITEKHSTEPETLAVTASPVAQLADA